MFVRETIEDQLEKVNSTENEMGRFYQSPSTGLWYPSVTTVTGYAKKDFFAEWRKKPENQKQLAHASARGTKLHSLVEKYLCNVENYKSGANLLQLTMFNQIKDELDKIGKIKLQEAAMWSDTIKMAGRTDCIAEYEGKLSVIDFKGSTKPKREEWITNYYEQAAAYAIMYRERFGIEINQIVIMIANETGEKQIFKKNPINYFKSLKSSIDLYWKDVNFDAIQERCKES